MLYLTCRLDGSKIYDPRQKEGAGSLLQFIVVSYLVSLRYKVAYHYTPIINIGHRETFNVSQEEWDSAWNEYIRSSFVKSSDPGVVDLEVLTTISSLPVELQRFMDDTRSILINLDWRELKKHLDQDISLLLTARESLLETYTISPGTPKTYFDSTKRNISIHIRRYSATDCDPNPCRELYQPGSEISDYFMDLVKGLLASSKDSLSIHIHSQGSRDDFAEFVKLDPTIVQLHIDEHPITTLHHLIISDVLVMSKSSFSLIANYYSQGTSILRPGFWHQVHPDTVIINQSDKCRLTELLKEILN